MNDDFSSYSYCYSCCCFRFIRPIVSTRFFSKSVVRSWPFSPFWNFIFVKYKAFTKWGTNKSITPYLAQQMRAPQLQINQTVTPTALARPSLSRGIEAGRRKKYSHDAIRRWWGFYKSRHTSWCRNKFNFGRSFSGGRKLPLGFLHTRVTQRENRWLTSHSKGLRKGSHVLAYKSKRGELAFQYI